MEPHPLRKSHAQPAASSRYLIFVPASALSTMVGGSLTDARSSSYQNVGWISLKNFASGGFRP